MFTDLQDEINRRCLATERFFDSACRPGDAQVAATAKGIAFVQLYAVYEYTTKRAVQAALQEMRAAAHPVGDLAPELLSLALHTSVSSIIDSGRKTQWNRRMALFTKSCSTDPIDVPDNAFPNDGSHFRIQQLRTIWAIFGITDPVVPTVLMAPLIAELVENRNAIAHGRKTAHEVGRRYSKAEIKRKNDQTKQICTHIVSTIENHCSNPANLMR